MKIQNIDGTERNETRQEILDRHAASIKRHAESMVFLESLHYGEPFYTFQSLTGLAAIRAESTKRKSEAEQSEGLTSEINSSSSLVSVSDTVKGCEDVLRRHPHGYKGFTDDENRDAAKHFPTKTLPEPVKPKVILTDYARKLIAGKK